MDTLQKNHWNMIMYSKREIEPKLFYMYELPSDTILNVFDHKFFILKSNFKILES